MTASTMFGSLTDLLSKHPENAGLMYAFGMPNPTRISKQIGKKVLDKFLTAKRFHLSCDAIAVAAVYGFNVDDPLGKMMNVAKAPFQSMWIEWPVVGQLRAIGVEPAPDAPTLTGVLVSAVPNQPTRVMITFVGAIEEAIGKIGVEIPPLSFIYDCEKPIDRAEFNDAVMFLQEATKNHVAIKSVGPGSSLKVPEAFVGKQISKNDKELMPITRYENYNINMLIDSVIIGGRLRSPDECPDKSVTSIHKITKHISICFTPWLKAEFDAQMRSIDKSHKDALNEAISYHFGEISGIVRVVLGILALINSRKYVHSTTIRPGSARPDELTKPKNQPIYEFVSMKVPQTVVLKDIHKDYQHGSQGIRPRHDVSGHWRTYHRTGSDNCEHAFANQDESGEHKICLMCGRKVTWIHDHKRGNIEKGDKTRRARFINE